MKITTPELKVTLAMATREDFENKINLHNHSVFSDGKLTPEQIQQQANSNGLKLYAVTDHNTSKGLLGMTHSGDSVDVSGAEIDCWHKGARIHILGLNIDPNDKDLNEFMVKSKEFMSKNPKNWLPKKERKAAPSAKEALSLIKKAGGMSSFAHPGVTFTPLIRPFIKGLKKLGLDAVEAYYPYKELKKLRSFQGKKILADIAAFRARGLNKFTRRNGLLNTSGIDCHTTDIKRSFDDRYTKKQEQKTKFSSRFRFFRKII